MFNENDSSCNNIFHSVCNFECYDSIIDNNDPDINFYNEYLSLINSPYVNDDSVNNDVCTNYNQNSFKMIHINIRSIKKNFIRLLEFLSEFSFKYDIIAISETWLEENLTDNFHIQGYNSEFMCRKARKGGGVAIYIKDSINYNIMTDYCVMENVIESLIIELTMLKTSGEKLIVGTFYRPPGQNVTEFCKHMNTFLTKVSMYTCYCLGDFNINIMNEQRDKHSVEFTETFLSHGYLPLINRATRVQNNKMSLLDNIYTNNLDSLDISSSYVVLNELSDHYPVIHLTKLESSNTKSAENVYYKRCLTPDAVERLNTLLLDENFKNELLHKQDVNASYDYLITNLNIFINQSMPLTAVKIRNGKMCPWISNEIKLSIKDKNKMYKKYIKEEDNGKKKEYENQYKQLKNKITSSLRVARKKYYNDKLEINKNNTEMSWKIVKEIINKSRKQAPLPKNFNSHDNRVIYDNDFKIANGFANYFVNVTKSIKVNHEGIDDSTMIGPQAAHSLFMMPTSATEIKTIVLEMKNTGPGWDGIPINIIKTCVDSISPLLEYIFNLSITTGIVPEGIKIARVTPIYKSGKKTIFNNYRPISNLPLFSKILEKIVNKQLIYFLQRNNIFYDGQFGFRKNYSTEHALLHTVTAITNALDNSEYAITLFLDLQKAFDLVDHRLLIKKLHHLGIRGIINDWLKSYLDNRKQYVQIGKTKSKYHNVCRGLPQGGTLAPTLFLLFINDIGKVNLPSNSTATLFADDTSLTLTGNNISQLYNEANSVLEKIHSWVESNKLALNIDKTKYMVFATKNKKKLCKDNTEYNLKISNKILERVTEIKFLGIIVDEQLNWKAQVQYVNTKLSKSIGVIYKAAPILSENALRNLYYTFCYPHILYGIIVWGKAYKTNINPLQITLKKILRIITKSPYLTHTEPLYKRLKIMKIYEVYKLRTSTFIFLHSLKALPNVFQNMFTTNTSSYTTRQTNDYKLPQCKTNIKKNSILYQGPFEYNKLTNHLKSLTNVNTFKRNLKQLILNSNL